MAKFWEQPGRYEGKPFLRLVELYVLDAIGQLHDHYRETAEKMEPRLQATYGTKAPWQQIIAEQMEFPDTLPAAIRGLWDGYLEHHRKLGNSVDPEEFVVEFVDKNIQL